jgi:hypothetical protein
MGRIKRTYPRPEALGHVPIFKGRVLFLSPSQAIRYHLHRAEPLVWLCLFVAVIGACVAVGF